MSKAHLILTATISVLLACNQSGAEKKRTIQKTVDADTFGAERAKVAALSEKKEPFPSNNISPFKGVVVISDTAHFSDGFYFNIYNDGLSLWKKVKFSPELTDSFGIGPYVFNYDNYKLVFRCVEKKGDYYRIVINEKEGIVKLISSQEKNLMFQTWEQHLLSVYAVEFNPKKNPLRKDADSIAATIPYDKEQTYMPEKIKRDWLLVKWGEEQRPKRGWIKWKDGAGNLLVEIFYVE